MNRTYSHYYKINEYLLSSMGIWPYQSKLKKRLITITIYIASFSVFLPVILGLIKSFDDIDSTLECIPPIIVIVISLTLLTNCIYNMDKMKSLFLKIEADWNTWLPGPEAEIIHCYAKKGKKFCTIFSILIFSNMFDYLSLPLISPALDLIIPLNQTRPRNALLITEYFINQEEYFFWIYLHGCLSSFIFIIILVGADAIFIVVIYHACGELAILGFRLQNLLKIENNYSSSDITVVKEVNWEIKFCVERHEKTIIFVNDICDCFSTANLLLLWYNMIIISITGVQTIMNLNKTSEAVTYGAFAIGQMIHLYCLSVPCQELIDHSIQITDYIYSGFWYQLPPRSQNMLIMIMRKNLKPASFTAGKLYTFSMENFASILRLSMSYFTVLSSIR